jgi:hypothetical protein
MERDTDSETEEEKQSNKQKVPYNDILTRKLVDASDPLSSFTVKEGFKNNTKQNATNKIAYVKCLHNIIMPVRYVISQHQINKPLNMAWKVKCVRCIEKIIENRALGESSSSKSIQKPDNDDSFMEGPLMEEKADAILIPLMNVIKNHLQLLKNRLLAVAYASNEDPVIVFKNKADRLQNLLAKIITKYIQTLESPQEVEDDMLDLIDERINFIFESLFEVIQLQLQRIKSRVLSMAETDVTDPFELLQQNAEVFGQNIGNLFKKCIDNYEDTENND